MKPVDQTKFGHGEGNCFAAAIASVLELPIDLVPGVTPDEAWGSYMERLRAWLSEHDHNYIEVKHDGFESHDKRHWGWHLICAKGPRNRDTGQAIYHAVVGFNGDLKHDPHPSRRGVLPPSEDNPWFYGFLARKLTR